MAVEDLNDAAVLSNGVRMPWLGLGVYRMAEGDEVIRAVRHALQVGYRHIDTAMLYGNEAGVGEAIRSADVPRDQIFVTTKVWNSDQGYDSTLRAFEDSRKRLGFDQVDLYLIHWPVPGQFKDTWRALERLYRDGRARAIGVCNFQVHHLEELLTDAQVVPMVNQVECHPFLTQANVRAYCRSHGIQVEAWAPLARGHLDPPLLAELGHRYGKTPAQIVLRWDLEHEVVTIPKSSHPERIAENANLFDFRLTPEDVAAIDRLNADHRFGLHPDHF